VVTAWIGLGSNVGDGIKAMARAVEGLSSLETTRMTGFSSLYETAPVEVTGGNFINAVARIETGLTAGELLTAMLQLENAMGRVRTPDKVSGRTIDLDLLLYGGETIAGPGLTVPHPRMTHRRFVMVPLAELASDLPIPGTGQTAAQIARGLETCGPDQRIKRLGTLEDLMLRRAGQGLDQPSPVTL
jgi:2-amino-4-hydroxy-6-hydroxymethyldihydropteridine diphosphokinase